MRNTRKRPIPERFWEKVDVQGDESCWEWTGVLSSAGYGQICAGSPKRHHELAHRVSYTLNCGPIPDGAVIMHSCNNKKCVNPKHLAVGNHSSNAVDARNDGLLGYCTLTMGQAEKVRGMLECKHSRKSIADTFCISIHVVNDIACGRTYKQVEQNNVLV